ncbi:MAG: RHS repeat protein, partial [Deltaproteobacteria bacterium]|nr:RHS repeat protein [Deltaproteobacteria bacterium]
MWNKATMSLRVVILTAVIFLSAPFVSSIQSQDINESIQSLRSFNYQTAMDMGKLRKYARGEANKFLSQPAVTDQMRSWAVQAREKWVAKYGDRYVPTKPLGEHTPGDVNMPMRVSQPWEGSGEYREFLKQEFKNQMQIQFPGMVDQFMRNNVLKGADIAGDGAAKVQQMISSVTDQATNGLGEMVDKTFHEWTRGTFGGNMTDDPAGFVGPLQNQLSEKMGLATKDGMKDFIDKEMFDMLGANFEQKLNDLTQGAADTMESIKDKMDSVKNIDLAAIEANLKDMLEGSKLPNPFNLSAGDYLGHQFHKLKGVPTLGIPDIEIPSPAMAGIWAVAAHEHFRRSVKCCIWIDIEEVKSGINLIKHLIWQLEKKPRSFMMIGGDFAGRGIFGGHGAKGLTPEQKAKLEELAKMAEGLSEKMDPSKAKEKLDEIMGGLSDFKVQMDEQIVALGKAPEEGYETPEQEGEEKSQACAEGDEEACGYEEVKVASKEDQTGATDESPQADSDSPLDPVILYSGEYALEAADLKLRGRGLDYELKRYYRNQWERMGPLGYNWTHNYDEKLILNPSNKDVVHQSAEGLRYWYRFNEKRQGFNSPRGFFTELGKTEGGYVLKQADASRHYFNSEGRLTKIEDPHGNALRFEYGLSGSAIVLVRVVDTLGRAVEYRYSDEGLLASVADSFGREVVYTHDVQKDLVSVRSPVSDEFPQGKTTRYAYSGGLLEPRLNHNLNMIMDPKGQVYLKNVYGAEGLEKDKITAQLFGGKESLQMRVEYQALKASKPTVNTALSRTTVWDRKGVQHTYEHNAQGLRLSHQAEKNSPEKFEYNNVGLVTKHIYPSGKEELFSYEGRDLVEQRVKGEDGKTIQVRYGYDKELHKPLFREMISGAEKRREEYAYTPSGLLKEIRRGDLVTVFEYNEHGQLIAESEGQKARRYGYQGADLVSLTETAGEASRALRLAYDLRGNIQAVTDPMGNQTRYWVSADNLVAQKEDALKNKTYYRYDANDNLMEVTRDVAGALNAADLGYQLRERYNYDVLDNLIKKELQVNREKWVAEEYAYDLNENLTRIKGIDGTAREFVYDPFNRVTEEKAGGETQRKLEYDADGFLIAESDAKGNRKEYQRDSLSRVAKFIDPLGSHLEIDYTGLGEIAGYQFKDAKAAILKEVRFAYDALGRKVSEEERLVGSAEGTQDWVKKEFVYAGPLLKEIRDPLGLAQKFGYNSFGEVAAIEDASGNAIQLSYDSRGLITERKIAKGLHSLSERYQYDALGQIVSQTDAKGASYQKIYNSLGQLIKEIDPLNQETLYYYDGIGRLLKEAQGTRERKLLWNNEVLEAFLDGQGNKVQYTYDSQGRKKTEVGADGVRREYAYDAAGNLTSLTAGQTKYDYTYDALNRLIERASGAYKQTYGYDPLGRLTAGTDLNDPADPTDDITSQFGYDNLGNLVQETLAGRTLKKRFDIRGQKTALFYPSGEEVTQSFDPAGWLENIQVNGQSVSQYQYALLGFTQKETLGNGITKNLNYDSLMQLVEENYQKEKNILSKLAYAYDLKGRVILKEDVKQKTWEVFGYNNLDQLEKVGKTEGPRGNKNSWDQAWSLAATKREYTYAAEGQWRSIIETDGKKTEEVTNIASGAGFQYASFNGDPLA